MKLKSVFVNASKFIFSRIDIAEEKIFTNRSVSWKEGDLDEVMLNALLLGRKTFVELLIVNGFSMSHFLTVKVRSELEIKYVEMIFYTFSEGAQRTVQLCQLAPAL